MAETVTRATNTAQGPVLDLTVVGQGLATIRDHHTLVAITPDAGVSGGLEVTLSDPASWTQATAWIQAQQFNRANVYFHANEVRSGIAGKAKKADLLACDMAQSDVDPMGDGTYDERRARAVALVQGMLDGPNPPSVVINSGNGFNVLWRLETALSVEDYDAANWHWNRAQGVTGTFNADRILKVPGTIAFSNAVKLSKGYPPQVQAGLVSVTGSRLTAAAFPVIVVPAQAHNGATVDDGAFQGLAVTDALSERVKAARAAHSGFDRALGDDWPDRSDALHSVAMWMHRLQFTSQEYAVVVEDISGSAGDHMEDQSNPIRALRRCWESADPGHAALLARMPAVVDPVTVPVVSVEVVQDFDPHADLGEVIAGLQPLPLSNRAVIDPRDQQLNMDALVKKYFTYEGKPTLVTWQGQTYRWMVTHWEAVEDSWLMDILFHYFSKLVCVVKKVDGEPIRDIINPSIPFRRNYLDAIKAITARPRGKAMGWSGTWQAVSNGILDMNTGKLVMHDPDFFNTSYVDAPWEPGAGVAGTVADRFFRDLVVQDDQFALLQEMFGYILSGDTSLQKAFMLIGKKRCGKGTLTRCKRRSNTRPR